MPIPAQFREADLSMLHKFIHRHGFGVLTTRGRDGLNVSHLPILLDESRGPHGTLRGHFSKGNDQVGDFDCQSLVVFSGPHAYISPTWYQTPDTVPTWNFVAVYAHGILKRVEGQESLIGILRDTVQKYEGSRPEPWTFDPSTDFHRKLLDGIVGFEIQITRLEGKWKLNQNHPVERRQRVIQALTEEGGEDSLAIARLMAESASG